MATIIAYTHHEKFDGSGYPRRLKGSNIGSNIPIEGRITMIADVFDALINKRVYKEAYSVEDSLKIMKDEMRSAFDPEIFNIFEKNIDEILDAKEKIDKDNNKNNKNG